MHVLLFVTIIALLALSVPGCADDFIISYWCGPPADSDPDERYAEVAECNFTYCLPPVTPATVDQNKAILDACAKHGLKYIVGDQRIMAKSPDDPEFAANLDAVIADYADHPAMGGYFITDEPNAREFPKLAAINEYLLNKDPKHLPFINLFPNYANEAQLGTPTYREHVEQFCSIVKPRILSYDHYIMMACDPENPVHLGSYFDNMEIVRAEALKRNIPACFILLSIPHGSYRDPTESDLRWQVFTALTYGYKAILYFTYWTPHSDYWDFRHAIIEEDGSRTERFDQVKRINGEIKALAPTLMKLTSTGVYHTGDVPDGCVPPPADLPLQVSGRPVVLGLFRHEDGSTWAMVTNRQLRKANLVTLEFDPRVKSIQELSRRTGKLRNLGLHDGKTRLNLRPGEGRLLKLVKQGS